MKYTRGPLKVEKTMTLSRKASFLIAAVLLLAAYLGGFVPQYLKNREATAQLQQTQAQLAEAQAQLRLAVLQNNLGLILVEVEQNNFRAAKERSTKFFDDLRQTIALANTGVSESGEQWIYNAKHPHTLALAPSGSCTGKLIVNQERVVYESLEDREHTRQWPLVDIKKIKRKSPYKIEIESFNREKYTLELEGQGMDIAVFKKLQNWISLARSRR